MAEAERKPPIPWDELPYLDDERIIAATFTKFTTIGCPYYEWTQKCPHDPIECAGKGRCYKIHTERHT